MLTRWAMRSSGVWDDAIWDLSLILHRQGRFREEIRLLERFLETRVIADQPGSYEHVNYKFAWLRIARVTLDDLIEPREAARWLTEFPDHFEYARARDEALHWLAVAWDRAGEPERAAAARADLERLFPESRWLKVVAP